MNPKEAERFARNPAYRAEQIVKRVFGGKRSGTHDYDVGYGLRRVEVKSRILHLEAPDPLGYPYTIRFTRPPESFHELIILFFPRQLALRPTLAIRLPQSLAATLFRPVPSRKQWYAKVLPHELVKMGLAEDFTELARKASDELAAESWSRP